MVDLPEDFSGRSADDLPNPVFGDRSDQAGIGKRRLAQAGRLVCR
jgi:hypothetical protein